MNITEFRRLLETKPTLTLSSFTINGVAKPHKFHGIPRRVHSVLSKNFALEGANGSEPSWMDIPKKGELTVTEDGKRFTIIKRDGPSYTVALTYEVSP